MPPKWIFFHIFIFILEAVNFMEFQVKIERDEYMSVFPTSSSLSFSGLLSFNCIRRKVAKT